MYITYFIARRIRSTNQKAFTTLVHKIGVISVALGLAIMLMAFLIMRGFQQNIVQKINSFSGHLQIFKYSANRSFEEPPMASSKVLGLQQAFPDAIKALQAFAHKAVLLQTTEEVEGILCKGLDPGATHETLQNYLTAGKCITFDQVGYSHDLVISSQIAARLQLQVGDEVLAYVVQHPPRYRKLKIAGIYTTYIADLDEKLAFCDLRLIQRLNDWNEGLVGGYEVFLNDRCLPKEVTPKIQEWLDYDLRIQSTGTKYATLFEWIAIVRKHTLLFIMLLLLVVSFNMASIVLIQLMERTAMIGILKTLGASDGQIQRIMLWNNLHLLAKGMLGGNIIGLGLCALQTHYKVIQLDPAYYYISHIPILWDWQVILALNALTFGVVIFVLRLSLVFMTSIRIIRAIQFR